MFKDSASGRGFLLLLLLRTGKAKNSTQQGSAKVANVVFMGALLEETECLSPATAMKVLEAKVKNPALLELDRKALDAGRVYIDHTVAVGAVTQADGFAQ